MNWKSVIGLLITVGMGYGVVWLGLKGMIGFVVGMGLMAVLLLTKNPLLLWLIELTESVNYIDAIRQAGNVLSKKNKKDDDFIEVGRR